MFNTACPGLLGTPSEFRKQYELPILAGRDAGATDKQIERVRCGVALCGCCSPSCTGGFSCGNRGLERLQAA